MKSFRENFKTFH